jgi:hypothetical protein
LVLLEQSIDRQTVAGTDQVAAVVLRVVRRELAISVRFLEEYEAVRNLVLSVELVVVTALLKRRVLFVQQR